MQNLSGKEIVKVYNLCKMDFNTISNEDKDYVLSLYNKQSNESNNYLHYWMSQAVLKLIENEMIFRFVKNNQ